MADLRTGYVFDLLPADRQLAKKELGEDPTQVQSQISTLRDWLQQQRHMRSRDDDHFLLMFLRQAKFSQIRAREVIEKYTKNRVTDPFKEIYVNKAKLDPAISAIILSGAAFVIPGLPKSGYRTFVYRGGDVDTSKYNFRQSMAACMVCIDISFLDPVTQIHGHQWLADFKNATMGLLSSMTPTNMRICAAGFMDATPLRLKGVHFFNCPTILGGVISILRSFLSAKIASRVHNHWSEMKLIHKQIDKAVLPSEYGGSGGTVLQMAAQWHDHVLRNIDRLEMFSVTSYDEKLKTIGATKTTSMEGAFRKLNVD